MRAYEFLREHMDEQDIQTQLTTILTSLHGSGLPRVDIKQVQKSLELAGFFVNIQWIQDSSRQLGIVQDVDDTSITLDVDTDEPTPRVPDAESDEEKVSKMAKKALSRRKK